MPTILIPTFLFSAMSVYGLRLPSSQDLQAKGLPKLCEEDEALWDGSDDATICDFTTKVTSEFPKDGSGFITNIQIFGLYDSGTNLMQSILHQAFPHASVCPDTRAHASAKTCRSHSTSKHSHPEHAESFLKQNTETLAVMVVRDPFSHMESIHRNPYGLSSCMRGSTWLHNHCDCSGEDPICASYEKKGFKSIVDVWQQFTEGHYKNVQEFPNRAILVRYEDVVMDPIKTTQSIADRFGIHMSSSFADSIGKLDSSQKQAGVGRQKAIEKIKGKTYLASYPDNNERQQVCSTIGTSSIIAGPSILGDLDYVAPDC